MPGRAVMGRLSLAFGVLLLAAGCTNVPTPSVSATPSATATSSCPVTAPAAPETVPEAVAAFTIGGMILPSGMTPPPLRTMYGNAAIWVDLGTIDGTLRGVVGPGGHLGAKFPTFRLINGSLTVSASRLDGPGTVPSTQVDPSDSYGTSGFVPVGVDFPSPGCWSITETVPGHGLEFVVRLVSESGPAPTPTL